MHRQARRARHAEWGGLEGGMELERSRRRPEEGRLTLWVQCRGVRQRRRRSLTIGEKRARREQRIFPKFGRPLLAVLSWRIPCTN